MMGDACSGWPCLECIIRKQEYDNNIAALEKRFLTYKQKLVLTDELVRKYKTVLKENEVLKKCQSLEDQYRTRLSEALSKLSPTEKELESVKEELSVVKKQLEELINEKEASLKHNEQLTNYSEKLNAEIESLKATVENKKESVKSVSLKLKQAKSEVLSVKRKRTRTIQALLPIAEIFLKDGSLDNAQKRNLTSWRRECIRMESKETANISEDEGIFSPDIANSCSSRDTGSITELLSDDDQTSVLSLSIDSGLNSKDISVSDMFEVGSKSRTSEHLKKPPSKKNKKPSLGNLVPLNLESNNEFTVSNNNVQERESCEVLLQLKEKVENTKKSSLSLGLIEECSNDSFSHNISQRENKLSQSINIFSPKSCDSALDLSDDKTELQMTESMVKRNSLFDPDTPIAYDKEEIKFQTFYSENDCKKTIREEKNLPCSDEPKKSPCKEIVKEEVLPSLNESRNNSDIRPESLEIIIENEIDEILRSFMKHPPLLSPMSPSSSLVIEESDLISPTKKEKVEVKEACTMTVIEMLDAAVGVDKDFVFHQHAAIQTLDNFSLNGSKIVMQDASTSCSEQYDSNDICHCKLRSKNVENVSKNDYATQTNSICLIESGTSTEEREFISCYVQTEENSENTYKYTKECIIQNGDVSQNIKTSRKPWEIVMRNRTSEQKSARSKISKCTSMIRYDYIKSEESNLKDKLTKVENLLQWLCSIDSDLKVLSSNEESSEENSAKPQIIENIPHELTVIQADHSYCVQEIKSNKKDVDSEHLLPTGVLENQSSNIKDKLRKSASGLNSDSNVESNKIPSSFPSEIHSGTKCNSSENENSSGNQNNTPCNLPDIPVQLPYHDQYVHMNMLFQLAIQSAVQSAVHSATRGCAASCCQNADVGRYKADCGCHSHKISEMNVAHCCKHSFCNNCKNSEDICEHLRYKRKRKRIIDMDDSSDDLNYSRSKHFTKKSLYRKNHIMYSSDSDVQGQVSSNGHKRSRRKIPNQKRRLFKVLREKFKNKKLKISEYVKSEEKEQSRVSNSGEEDYSSSYDEEMNEKESYKKDKCLKKVLSQNSLPKHKTDFRSHMFNRRDDSPRSNLSSDTFKLHEVVRNESKLSSSVKQNKNNSENSSAQTVFPGRQVTEHSLYKELFGSEAELSSDEECRNLKKIKLSENLENENISDVPSRGEKLNMIHEKREREDRENLFKTPDRISCSAEVHQEDDLEIKSSDKPFGSSQLRQRQNTRFSSRSSTLQCSTRGKLSKLQKYRRVLAKAKLPCKIVSVESEKPPKTKRKEQSEVTERVEANSSMKGLPKVKDKITSCSGIRKTSENAKEIQMINDVKKSLPRGLSGQIVPTKFTGIEIYSCPQNNKGPMQTCYKLSRYSIAGVEKNDQIGVNLLKTPNMPQFQSTNRNVADKTAVQNNISIADFTSHVQNEPTRDSQNSQHTNNNSSSCQTTCYNPIKDSLEVVSHAPHIQPPLMQDINKCLVSSPSYVQPLVQDMNRDNRPVLVSAPMDQVNKSAVVVSGTLSEKDKFVEISEKEENTHKEVPSIYPELPQYLDSPVKQSGQLPQYLDSPVKQSGQETMNTYVKVPSTYCELPHHLNSPVPHSIKEIENKPVNVPSMYRELPEYLSSPVKQPSKEMEENTKLTANANNSVRELASLSVSPIKESEEESFSKEDVSSLSVITEGDLVLKEEVLSPRPVSEQEYVLLGMQVENGETGDSETAHVPGSEEDTKDYVRPCTRSFAHIAAVKKNTNVEKTKFHAGYALRKAFHSIELSNKTLYRKSKFAEVNNIKEQKKIVAEAIKRLISAEDSNIDMFKEIVSKLGQLDTASPVMVLSKYMVRFISKDKDIETMDVNETCNLTRAQQRLLTLLYKLHSQYEQYKELPQKVLLGIEYSLFRLGYAPLVPILCSLTKFYAALCDLFGDKKRLQTFCYDALYCMAYKAYPLLYIVIKNYPDTIPHANAGKDNILVTCMISALFSHEKDKNYSNFKVTSLKTLLKTKYGYKTVYTFDKLFNILVEKLKSSEEKVEHLETSFILLAKRMGYDIIYKKLITKIFYPLLNDWRKGSVRDKVVEDFILIVGYVTRCFPVIEAKVQIQDVLNHLRSILVDEKNVSIKIQEAAVLSLLRLSRSSFIFVASVLLNWRPSSDVSDEITKEIKSFLSVRKPKWWQNFLSNGQYNLRFV